MRAAPRAKKTSCSAVKSASTLVAYLIESSGREVTTAE